jgi:hypothetical protein
VINHLLKVFYAEPTTGDNGYDWTAQQLIQPGDIQSHALVFQCVHHVEHNNNGQLHFQRYWKKPVVKRLISSLPMPVIVSLATLPVKFWSAEAPYQKASAPKLMPLF